jgi:hypothetical protein
MRPHHLHPEDNETGRLRKSMMDYARSISGFLEEDDIEQRLTEEAIAAGNGNAFLNRQITIERTRKVELALRPIYTPYFNALQGRVITDDRAIAAYESLVALVRQLDRRELSLDEVRWRFAAFKREWRRGRYDPTSWAATRGRLTAYERAYRSY